MEIERVKSVKLLGIIVTDKVTWNENSTYICSKASKRLYHLKHIRSAKTLQGIRNKALVSATILFLFFVYWEYSALGQYKFTIFFLFFVRAI